MPRTTASPASRRDARAPRIDTDGPRVGVKHDPEQGAIVRVLTAGEASVFGLVNRAADDSAAAIKRAGALVAGRFQARTGQAVEVRA